jgi:membrane protein DedA with SNARE-associated domain
VIAAVLNIGQLLHHYGYGAVFLLVGCESLGIPLPGETILVAAGIYASRPHHPLSVWVLFLVAAAAAITGDNIGFWVGDRGGYRLLKRYGHYVRVDETKLKIGRYLFDRHGGKVVFFGRFVSVLRTYAAFLAGTAKMRWRQFLPWNAAGGIIWAAIYSYVPYEVGAQINRASTPIDVTLGVIAAVIVIGLILLARRQADRLAERAEAIYPGPLPDR